MNERDSIRSLKDALTICFMLYFGIFAIFAIWLMISREHVLIFVLLTVGILMFISNILYMSVERFRDRWLFKFATILMCIPIYPIVVVLNSIIKGFCAALKRNDDY